jgi:hypothetical protein
MTVSESQIKSADIDATTYSGGSFTSVLAATRQYKIAVLQNTSDAALSIAFGNESDPLVLNAGQGLALDFGKAGIPMSAPISAKKYSATPTSGRLQVTLFFE